MAAIPLSTVIGAPLSGLLLYLHGGMGLSGWQWMFIIEAVPAVLLSIVVLTYLTDRPIQAQWLEPEERTWLSTRLASEQQQRQAVHHHPNPLSALVNSKVLALAVVYFGAVATNYGTGFWLPQIVKAFGLTIWETSLVAALPYVVGTIGMVWWGRRSDKHMERKGHAAFALACAALGIGLSTVVDSPTLKMVALSFGTFGVFAVLPVFWTFPTAFLSGAAAAAGIAAINSIGNLAGFAGPFLMGWLKDVTGSFSAGLLLIAAFAVAAMIVVLLLHHDATLERAPERQPAE
jgi:MFS transporter, ACS family, tartrate transporter